ncbi:large conductance mechanosensitive channel protein MscL [Edaphobacter dinghuensis]|uniref:Large-conductance mechanosensitive channel n=1 Tax=Edaphobacter dinghuensis TaxID=1560005 RepID=A0A917M603_9BACT|nr:large conductance mechanosensitive channel protein MscL [Edaphobacter dinghuensis]GGG81203.1 large-conductance mechanosensitive channel [Edaphobacter dinghuensis]
MLKGFRDFVLRGNVIDLAVAVIIGAAFTNIVASLTKDIINPLIAAIVGKPDFSYLVAHVNGGAVTYGNFINAVIAFLLLAFVIYFFLVLPTNHLLAKLKGPEAASNKTCGECLSEIPLAAHRCKFCGQPVA